MTAIFPFDEPLVGGRLVRRYKRFLADIELEDGTVVTAHCPNSGSMLGMNEPGMACMVRHVDDPKRKLAWTWELVAPWEGTWVGINTMRPNQVAAWAVENGLVRGVPAMTPRREVPYADGSRVDLVAGDHFIEVKNTTLAYHEVPGAPTRVGKPVGGGRARRGPARAAQPPVATDAPAGRSRGHIAAFPDAVTSRGAKHMDALASVVEAGGEATVLFFVNRGDCDRFTVASNIDPAYAAAWQRARDAGVRMLPMVFEPAPDGWRLRGELPLV